MIRRSTVIDVPQLGQLINDCAEQGIMLHRSLSYLYEHLRDFFVITEPHCDLDSVSDHIADPTAKKGNTILGVCGLKVVWADLAEVYALAVAPKARGRGYGRQLVQACIDESRHLEIRRLMTLSYEKTFFEKLGFEVVDRQKLPLKVWSECIRCAKNQACDEIAMVFCHVDMPLLEAPGPQVPPEGSYEVPVVLSGRLSNVGPRPKMDEAR